MRLIVTTMRNEGPAILEWLAYHRLIGFTDFLVFSNDCDDGTDAILDRLATKGLLTHLPNPPKGKKTVQWQALSRASDHQMVKDAEWIMVADVDEFLCIHTGAGMLDDLLAARRDASGFCLSWRTFGSDGRVTYSDDLVMSQFTRTTPPQMLWPWRPVQFKTLFRGGPGVKQLGVHLPKLKGGPGAITGWVDDNGLPMPGFTGNYAAVTPMNRPRYGLAQLNHYPLGSAEGFLVKADRGRPNRSHQPIGADYWIERNFNHTEDRSILRHEAAVRAQMQDWLDGDADLAALVAQSVKWRRLRIGKLLADPPFFALYTQLLLAGSSQVLPPEEQERALRMANYVQMKIRAARDQAKSG